MDLQIQYLWCSYCFSFPRHTVPFSIPRKTFQLTQHVLFCLFIVCEYANRFLKQKAAAGEWFEVNDDIAREKASQCLRDIVAAQRSTSRKRAFQSAPELNTLGAASKRMRLQAPTSGLQNATFGEPIATTTATQPLVTPLMPSPLPLNTTSSVQLPPKAVSCLALGAGTTMPIAASTNDRLLQQFQLVRAQQQQLLASAADATSHSQQNLLQSLQQQQRTRNVSFSNASFQPGPLNHGSAMSVSASTTGSGLGSANASWGGWGGNAAWPNNTAIASNAGSNAAWPTTGSGSNTQWQNPIGSLAARRSSTHHPATAHSNGNPTTFRSANAATGDQQQDTLSPLGWQNNNNNSKTTAASMLGSRTTTAAVPLATPSSNSGDDALKRWIDRMTLPETAAARPQAKPP